MKNNNNTPPWINVILAIGGTVLIGLLLAKLIEYLFDLFSEEEESKPRVFISHSWQYDKDYRNLINKLKQADFPFYNHSIPLEKDLNPQNQLDLERKIEKQILYTSRVLVLGGEYASRFWIKKEVEIAQKLKKQIIVIRPWGTYQVPQYLMKAATRVIGFNTGTIIESIK